MADVGGRSAENRAHGLMVRASVMLGRGDLTSAVAAFEESLSLLMALQEAELWRYNLRFAHNLIQQGWIARGYEVAVAAFHFAMQTGDPTAAHPDPRVLRALGSDPPGADHMSDPFGGIPLAAALTDGQLSERLGEPVRSGQDAVSTGSGRFGFAWFGGAPAWRHTSHSIGFIPAGASGAGAIRHVGEVEADPSLKDVRLRITLDGLRVADYPGGGIHRVLFNFFVQNRTGTGVEDVNFNATYRVREGESRGGPQLPHLHRGGAAERPAWSSAATR